MEVKFDNWVVCPFINPNKLVDVTFKLLIAVVWPFYVNIEFVDNELTLLFKVVKLVAYAYTELFVDVIKIDVIVPWIELSFKKVTVVI